jgi:hypothetical protein
MKKAKKNPRSAGFVQFAQADATNGSSAGIIASTAMAL